MILQQKHSLLMKFISYTYTRGQKVLLPKSEYVFPCERSILLIFIAYLRKLIPATASTSQRKLAHIILLICVYLLLSTLQKIIS